MKITEEHKAKTIDFMANHKSCMLPVYTVTLCISENKRPCSGCFCEDCIHWDANEEAMNTK